MRVAAALVAIGAAISILAAAVVLTTGLLSWSQLLGEHKLLVWSALTAIAAVLACVRLWLVRLKRDTDAPK